MHKNSLTRQEMSQVVGKLRGEKTLFKQTSRRTKQVVDKILKDYKATDRPTQAEPTAVEKARVRERQNAVIDMITGRRQTITSGQRRRQAMSTRATETGKEKNGNTKPIPGGKETTTPTKRATADRPTFMPSGINSLGRSARRSSTYTTPEIREMKSDTSSEQPKPAEDIKPEQEPTEDIKDTDPPSPEEADDMFIG